ncbi:hypothetical protein Dimus_016200, partial [Dionaea muscipula]
TRAAEGQDGENQEDDHEAAGLINDEADAAVCVEQADITEKIVVDNANNIDDEEDNVPLSSGFEVLRRSNKDDDDDNVPRSLKYQTTP